MDTSVQFLCFFAAYKCFNQHDEYKNFHIWIEITMFCDIWNTLLHTQQCSGTGPFWPDPAPVFSPAPIKKL